MSLKPLEVNFEEKWKSIEKTIHRVLLLESVSKLHWGERFYDIYALCIATPEPMAGRLYDSTRRLLEEHINNLRKHISSLSDELLLSAYYKYWIQYSEGCNFLNILFLYLNNHHVEKNKISEADITYGSFEIDFSDRLQQIGELGLDIWRRDIILKLKERLVRVLLDGIKSDRLGQAAVYPPSITRGVISSFVEVRKFVPEGTIKLYEGVFEKEFLNETGEFYKAEASALLQECSVSQYMSRVCIRLEDEKLRAAKFLPPSSHKRVEKEVQTRMVANHLATLQAEAPAMVSAEALVNLTNMYTLVKPVQNGLDCLVKNVQDHIKNKGLEVVNSLKGENIPSDFVENLLEVHNKYKRLMSMIFSNDRLFSGAMDKAFESIINHRTPPKNLSLAPELIAKYSDLLLRKSTKGLSESEVDDKLGQSIILFKYIDDKDIFHKFYSRFLAKRLIQQQSHSMDAEENMINRLKLACGYEYTSKLHRMYTDVSVSQGLQKKFGEYLDEQVLSVGINFNIFVLQAGAWPLGQVAVSPFSVPQELEKSVQTFEAFYQKNFNGRKLTWLHHLCQGELKCCFTKRTYFITLPTFQMAMLLMFEKVDSVTCEELQQHTGLNDEQFTKFLQSLIECKLLNCEDTKFEPSSVVELNKSFSNKRTKFKIAVAAPKETQQEVEQTHASVEEDRKLFLQAALVRIMKTRKLAKHNTLIEEVIGQAKMRFVPQIPMIKKCIEVLIDKQYIERATDSTDEYSYVA